MRHEVGHNVGPNVSTNDTPRPDLTLHATMNNRPALPHRDNVSNICLNRLTATLATTATTDIAVAGRGRRFNPKLTLENCVCLQTFYLGYFVDGQLLRNPLKLFSRKSNYLIDLNMKYCG